MKGLISGIKKFAVGDGEGIRTTVFFKGCPLQCVWCHNPESISYDTEIAHFDNLCTHCGDCSRACPTHVLQVSKDDFSWERFHCIKCKKCVNACVYGAQVLYGDAIETEELLRKLLVDMPFYEINHGGVTLSGGECLTQADFALSIAKGLYEKGVSVDIDTCGAVPWKNIESIIPYIDTFLYDIKAIDPQTHKKCTGCDNSLILENLQRLYDLGSKIEIRYPLVVGWNDMEAEKIGMWLAQREMNLRVKVLAYHDFARSRYTALGKVDTLPYCRTDLTAVTKAIQTISSFGILAIDNNT